MPQMKISKRMTRTNVSSRSGQRCTTVNGKRVCGSMNNLTADMQKANQNSMNRQRARAAAATPGGVSRSRRSRR